MKKDIPWPFEKQLQEFVHDSNLDEASLRELDPIDIYRLGIRNGFELAKEYLQSKDRPKPTQRIIILD